MFAVLLLFCRTEILQRQSASCQDRAGMLVRILLVLGARKDRTRKIQATAMKDFTPISLLQSIIRRQGAERQSRELRRLPCTSLYALSG